MAELDLVSVIVPALNEAESLDELYDRTRAALGSQPFEFIIVDDGSTDDTVARVTTLRERYGNVVLLGHYRNHGKSLALMQGFAAARGDVAVLMDADLQDQPEAIPAFLDKLAEGYDLVNGWRRERRDAASKVLVSSVFNLLTSRLLQCQLHDINCGFKAIRRTFYKKLELRGDLHRLIPAMVAGMGGRITEIPVPHCPRKHGQSRYRLLRHRGLLDIVALIAGNATRFRPFHVFCEAAALFWIGAVCCAGGWIGLTLSADASSLWMQLVRPLVAIGGVGLAWIGTMLPLFGFLLEVTTTRHQDAGWRRSLLKTRLGHKAGGHAISSPTERISPARRLAAVLEPAWQSVPSAEGTAAE